MDDLTYIEKKDFGELRVLEEAIGSIGRYYAEEERKVGELLGKGTITREEHSRRLEKLREDKRNAQNLVNTIQHAMNEYKSAIMHINALQNDKINMMIRLLQDKKTVKVFNEENKKIQDRKITAKQALVKALENKYLKKAMTAIRVDNSQDKMIDPEKSINSFTISSEPWARESLGQIVEHLKSNKIADEFIARSEKEQIQASGQPDVYKSFEESQYKGTILGTEGSSLYVNDEEYAELKKGEEQFQSIADDKLGVIDSIIKSDIRLDSKSQRKIQVTKEEYAKLANVNLEYQRVERALLYMDKSQVFELYPRTKIMLTEYRKRLLEQQKKLTLSSANLSRNANIENYQKQLDYAEKVDTFEKRKKHLEGKIEEARMINDLETVAKLEEELRNHNASFDTISFEEERTNSR